VAFLVADASRRTRKLNAYVSGLGRTRRIVLFDTLVSDAGRQEVQLVVAQELGHRRAQHVDGTSSEGPQYDGVVFVGQETLGVLRCQPTYFVNLVGRSERATHGSHPPPADALRPPLCIGVEG
jgi:Peptidase family M48